jgi:hypothetical protein
MALSGIHILSYKLSSTYNVLRIPLPSLKMVSPRIAKLFAFTKRHKSTHSTSENSKMLFNNLFSSKCLAYRVLENTEEDNELLTKSTFSDPNMYAQFYDLLITPPSSNFIHNLIRDYWTNPVLSVTICLPSSGESPAACSNPVPIGWLSVVAKSSLHHRSCTLSSIFAASGKGLWYRSYKLGSGLGFPGGWDALCVGSLCCPPKYERIRLIHR